MVKRWLRACGSAILAGALAMGACTPSPQAAADAAVANPEVQEMLRFVPADTPYAWIGLAGSTRPFAEKIAQRAAPLLQQAEAGLAAALADKQGDKPVEKVLLAAGAELKGKLSIEGLESLGLDFDARYAIYGLGLLPALRIRMKDTAALKATLDRIQAASGVQFPVANHKGQDYWHAGDSKFEFVAAMTGKDVVMAVILAPPGPARDRTLAVLFGQEAPGSSLADGSVLKDIIGTHGLGQYSAGFVDVRGLTEALLGASTGFNQETAAVLTGGATVSPECAAEYRGLAGLMPRIVMGTTRIDDAGIETKLVGELRADLAAGLAAVRTRVPGLDGATGKDVMFGIGSGVDVGQAVELAKAQAMVVEAAPFKCPNLSSFNEAARSIVRGVPEVPLPVRQLRGFAFALEDATFTGILPTNVRGYLTIGTLDPLGLLKTVKGFAPTELTMIPDLAEEGVPQRINLSGLPIPVPFEPYIAGRRDVGLAMAVGNDAEKRTGDLLAATGEATPLMVFHFNMGRFMKMLPPGLSTGNEAVFSIIGSQGYVLDANASGLIMRSWINFAE